MKTKSDPRHLKRRETVRSLFSYIFQKEQPLCPQAKEVVSNLDFIDKEITSSAPEWPLERINKIDLAILRLAVYELLIQKKEPPKVIIDEAVELAKEFGSENSAAFINGVLGNILKIRENELTQ
ncbi:transcription antitermination factor NusB [Candidatus Microgenomates bacterium]|nr:MAG: transcription antitermination factor NusB [Candidatus Microgenomates bacterium]